MSFLLLKTLAQTVVAGGVSPLSLRDSTMSESRKVEKIGKVGGFAKCRSGIAWRPEKQARKRKEIALFEPLKILKSWSKFAASLGNFPLWSRSFSREASVALIFLVTFLIKQKSH